MFGKLLRYELRSCFKKLGGLWIGAAVMFLINSVIINLVEFDDSIASSMTYIVSNMILTLTSAAVVIMSFVFIVTRFYKGLTGSEGYLMFTLPVKTESLILSKLTSAIIVQFISGVVAMIPFVVFSLFGVIDFGEIAQLFSDMFADIGLDGVALIGLLIPMAIFGMIEQIMRIYFSIAIGHRAQKHRVVWSIVTYMVTNYVISALASIVLTGSMISCLSVEDPDGIMLAYSVEAVIIIGLIVIALIEFFATRHIFSKKLNLE